MTVGVYSISRIGTKPNGYEIMIKPHRIGMTGVKFGFVPTTDTSYESVTNTVDYRMRAVGEALNSDFTYKGVHYNQDGTRVDAVGVIGGDALEKWLSPMAIPNIPISPLVTTDTSTADEPEKDNSLIKYGVIVVGVIIMIMVIISQIVRK